MVHTSIVLALLFILGTSLGSFLSVIIHRIHSQKSGIIRGRSTCPSCHNTLAPQDLIPILSYLFLRGRCRHCNKPIHPSYFFLELITGLVLAVLYLYFPFQENPSALIEYIFFAIYSLFFIGIFLYDLRTKTIPDLFLFPLLGAAIVGSLLRGAPDLTSILIALAIATIFFGSQILISRGTWLGSGDLYLSLSLAIIFGWQLLLVIIVTSYFLGALFSIPLILTKKANRKTTIPFAPFLVLGAFTALFFGSDLIHWYSSILHI